MKIDPLIAFLTSKMSMTDIYQPVVVRELLMNGGKRTKAQLAAALAQHDLSVQEYYEAIVMRWPKITLTKHGIIDYHRRESTFTLCDFPEDEQAKVQAVRICEQKIQEWIDRKRSKERAPEAGASVRYEVLKAAHGKCELCGISSDIRPIDIDHIVPRSLANKNGKIRKDGALMDVNDAANLQALCFSCNRAKRASDQTDFRRTSKLVRDRIPAIIESEGRQPEIRQLTGQALRDALYAKLVEEHAEFIAAPENNLKIEELADMVEVIFALAGQYGVDSAALLDAVTRKREARGGFSAGYQYCGDRPK